MFGYEYLFGCVALNSVLWLWRKMHLAGVFFQGSYTRRGGMRGHEMNNWRHWSWSQADGVDTGCVVTGCIVYMPPCLYSGAEVLHVPLFLLE
jgi:hypothetical protein